ncbi:hypothetical protein MXD59_04945 [Frankia sp. Ag45/Mut15]|uniref:Uncharacterized protein n=1 Tax=Frankia umida TaxID=573489 RepID=A0ABT0JUJ6_9ACTN|nr:hypothetical protein [Frankia umida]MCK9875136.1 hypothetical protein [Frankia umida]
MSDAARSTVRSAVPGFLPSTRAFRFTNSFAPEPLLTLALPRQVGFVLPGPPAGRPALGVGDASRGLCGGMIFAVRDLFEAGLAPPLDVEPPRRGSPLYAYLVRRLFASFDLPRGVLRYYGLMRAPDERPASRRWPLPGQPGAPGRPGGAARSLPREWPRIRLDLDTGRLAPLGIITVHSADPLQLGLNHQVLAYAYEQTGTIVTLRLYDPNTPLDRADDVTMSFDLAAVAVGANPAGPARSVAPAASVAPAISHTVGIGDRPIRALFHSRYRWMDPHPALGGG